MGSKNILKIKMQGLCYFQFVFTNLYVYHFETYIIGITFILKFYNYKLSVNFFFVL